MRYRFSVVLAGAAVALAGVIAGGAGASAATTPLATPVPTVGPTGTPIACPPALPITGGVSSVTSTSVTISYSMLLSPPCGYDPPVTVNLFASQEDAEQWQNPVAQVVSANERYGTVTIDGLTPDTQYWFRFSFVERQDPYVMTPVRTAPVETCTAVIAIDSGWGSGFVATVTVRNVSDETIDGWRVTWRWSGGQQILSAWNAVTQVSGADVAARNASYNGTLAPGDQASFGMLVSGPPPVGAISPACAAG